MRSLEDTRKKWDTLFSDETIGLDLRHAVKESGGTNPCEDGLRSVCWKSFLLYGPLSQSSWPKKLVESRSAYTSLRDHFLRFIEHPDDLPSSIDPLADDSNSPWASLRQDEVNRAEIFQDVERCLQDNYFFREPSTQKTLLDILFIYSKLHPDIGYRQGMHELLAPVLWVVERDAIDPKALEKVPKDDVERGLMFNALDAEYIEHDTFTLFCAIMQTMKSFYEMGETNSSSPIVARSVRIHTELLARIDPELAEHLTAIEILPQIFLIRWIRLLFGREFSFENVLTVWDLLFAENLNLSLIDMTCVAMLLRVRWKLMRADYSSALTVLLRYPALTEPFGPPTLVQDAIQLERHKSPQIGAELIGRYTGRRPSLAFDQPDASAHKPKPVTKPNKHRYNLSSPSQDNPVRPSQGSPARFQQYQKGLESAFQEVSKRAEGWGISKTVREVRGAVGEIRRNLNEIQSAGTSPRRSADVSRDPLTGSSASKDDPRELGRRVNQLEDRNKALAKMLGDVIEELRASRTADGPTDQDVAERTLNVALAKIQFVQVYLDDSDIPIPPPASTSTPPKPEQDGITPTEAVRDKPPPAVSPDVDSMLPEKTEQPPSSDADRPQTETKRLSRPSLAQSSFSWMLGEDRHRSSFVSSVSVPPEQRRDSDANSRPKQLFADGKKDKKDKRDKKVDNRRGSDSSEEDGFTMNSLRGGTSGD